MSPTDDVDLEQPVYMRHFSDNVRLSNFMKCYKNMFLNLNIYLLSLIYTRFSLCSPFGVPRGV